jgi:hypothetical protein
MSDHVGDKLPWWLSVFLALLLIYGTVVLGQWISKAMPGWVS